MFYHRKPEGNAKAQDKEKQHHMHGLDEYEDMWKEITKELKVFAEEENQSGVRRLG